jgi:hypothetical protein
MELRPLASVSIAVVVPLHLSIGLSTARAEQAIRVPQNELSDVLLINNLLRLPKS